MSACLDSWNARSPLCGLLSAGCRTRGTPLASRGEDGEETRQQGCGGAWRFQNFYLRSRRSVNLRSPSAVRGLLSIRCAKGEARRLPHAAVMAKSEDARLRVRLASRGGARLRRRFITCAQTCEPCKPVLDFVDFPSPCVYYFFVMF